MKAKVSSLEKDKELRESHIECLTNEVDDKSQKVEILEKRLDRQVIVDQNIEKELQDQIIMLTMKNNSLVKECNGINDEYDMLEEENARLRKESIQAKGATSRLEKIVYGKKIRQGSAFRTTRSLKLCVNNETKEAKELLGMSIPENMMPNTMKSKK